MEGVNYFVEERRYVVRFIFKSKLEAEKFRLPLLYTFRYELVNGVQEEYKMFIRVAQLKYD